MGQGFAGRGARIDPWPCGLSSILPTSSRCGGGTSAAACGSKEGASPPHDAKSGRHGDPVARRCFFHGLKPPFDSFASANSLRPGCGFYRRAASQHLRWICLLAEIAIFFRDL